MKFDNTKSRRQSFLILLLLQVKVGMSSINNRFRVYVEPFIQLVLPRWSALKNRARVQKIEFMGEDFVQLRLKTPHRWGGFQPGQHVRLGVLKNGAELKRCFSISSGVNRFKSEGTIDLTIQVQEKGQVTPWIHGFLKTGQIVTLSKAAGDFIIDPERPALLIAGGSGVTPFQSYIDAKVAQPTVLLHYSKDPSLFAGLNESENVKIHKFNTLERGRFSREDLERSCPDFRTFEIYLCGPGKMIEDVRNALLEMGCSKDQIHAEYFGAGPKNANIEADSLTEVHFAKSGNSVTGDKRNLLELAESVGLTPAFGCRMGVCHQCKCSKKQGVVYNTRTQQYSDAGAEDIQLCVSVPVNDVVINL